jgi:hypothetical protein
MCVLRTTSATTQSLATGAPSEPRRARAADPVTRGGTPAGTRLGIAPGVPVMEHSETGPAASRGAASSPSPAPVAARRPDDPPGAPGGAGPRSRPPDARAAGTRPGRRLRASGLRHLMAPTVNPAMKRSTKKLYRMAMGMLAMRPPAMMDPQK